ncbi:MAG: hypothetical protein QXW43_05665 [Candidatus Methanomethyliaceae archaeon]
MEISSTSINSLSTFEVFKNDYHVGCGKKLGMSLQELLCVEVGPSADLTIFEAFLEEG